MMEQVTLQSLLAQEFCDKHGNAESSSMGQNEAAIVSS